MILRLSAINHGAALAGVGVVQSNEGYVEVEPSKSIWFSPIGIRCVSLALADTVVVCCIAKRLTGRPATALFRNETFKVRQQRRMGVQRQDVETKTQDRKVGCMMLRYTEGRSRSCRACQLTTNTLR